MTTVSGARRAVTVGARQSGAPPLTSLHRGDTVPYVTTEGHAKRDVAVGLVLSGMSQAQVADELGVSSATVSRWMHDPDMRARLAEARAAGVARARAQMAQHGPAMLEVLRSVASDPETPALVRVRAACEYLDRWGMSRVEGEPGGADPGAVTMEGKVTVGAEAVAAALRVLADSPNNPAHLPPKPHQDSRIEVGWPGPSAPVVGAGAPGGEG